MFCWGLRGCMRRCERNVCNWMAAIDQLPPLESSRSMSAMPPWLAIKGCAKTVAVGQEAGVQLWLLCDSSIGKR